MWGVPSERRPKPASQGKAAELKINSALQTQNRRRNTCLREANRPDLWQFDSGIPDISGVSVLPLRRWQ